MPDLLQSQLFPQLREHQLVGLRPLRGDILGNGLTGDQRFGLLRGHRQAPLQSHAFRLVGFVRRREFDCGLELLPHARYRTPDGRPHIRQCCRDGPRVGDGGDLGAERLLEIQRTHPIGDVGGRQERRATVPELDPQHRVHRKRLEQQVGVRHLHALGIAGGTRCVDQGGHVIGLHCPPGGLEVEVVGTGGDEVVDRQRALGRAVEADDVLDVGPAGTDPVDILRLAHHHLGVGVVEQVHQLLGGQGVVHGERDGADVLCAHLERIELDAVGHHQRHRVAAPDAETGQACSDLTNLFGVLAPGQRLCVANGAERNGVGIDRGGALEGLAQGGGPIGCAHDSQPRHSHCGDGRFTGI